LNSLKAFFRRGGEQEHHIRLWREGLILPANPFWVQPQCSLISRRGIIIPVQYHDLFIRQTGVDIFFNILFAVIYEPGQFLLGVDVSPSLFQDFSDFHPPLALCGFEQPPHWGSQGLQIVPEQSAVGAFPRSVYALKHNQITPVELQDVPFMN